MIPILQKHHTNPKNIAKRKAIIKSLNLSDISFSTKSQYPKNLNTQKGNFA
jgi:hypothetical protein